MGQEVPREPTLDEIKKQKGKDVLDNPFQTPVYPPELKNKTGVDTKPQPGLRPKPKPRPPGMNKKPGMNIPPPQPSGNINNQINRSRSKRDGKNDYLCRYRRNNL